MRKVMLKSDNLFLLSLFICTFAHVIKTLRIMERTLSTLKRIEQDAEAIGKTIRNEGQVYRAELEERQRMGLQGDAAIKHYNEWMQRYGMEHLMVKEG